MNPRYGRCAAFAAKYEYLASISSSQGSKPLKRRRQLPITFATQPIIRSVAVGRRGGFQSLDQTFLLGFDREPDVLVGLVLVRGLIIMLQ